MVSLCILRPLAARATTRLATTPIRSSVRVNANSFITPAPLSLRLRTITTETSSTSSTPQDATTIPSQPTSASTTTTTATTTTTPSLQPTEGEGEVEGEAQQPRILPYFVGRNGLNNLSVYHKNKSGGNRKLTHLKRGEGDLMALKEDIRRALNLGKDEISVNNVTKHIVIKGHRRNDVLDFLYAAGF
ncbi:mitochondrial large subunit ribosomal protein-domain-containing protein [Xylariaceae sp. FL0594]|nr:mitochondrial large subunit ribosomal protein-domain-containing protein [Xylariaceae sp. FL0594]